MISIAKFISMVGEDKSATLFHMAKSLLWILTEYSEELGMLPLHERISDCSARLTPEATPAQLLEISQAAETAVINFLKHSNRLMQFQNSELLALVQMLTQTLSQVACSSTRTLTNIEEIQVRLSKASSYSDIREVRAELEACLKVVEAESVQNKKEARDTLARLRSELEEVKTRMAAPRAVLERDPVTGLMARSVAEWKLKMSYDKGQPAYVSLFRLSLLANVNSRYGTPVGDALLVHLQEQIKAEMAIGDSLYRWGPSSFLVVSPRVQFTGRAPVEMLRVGATRVEKEFIVRGRTVLLPLHPDWICLKTPDFPSPVELMRKLDEFDATPAAE